MVSLSVEEENYVRMSLLLTGISPRAARTFFDSEFAPACLDTTLKKEHNKLFDLKKKHRINQSQWNLIFPRSPDVPNSKAFDVTLMTLLLRNLTPMTPPSCGFDSLPSAMETTTAADLARIKHYRNYLAHLDDGKLDTTLYNTAWNDITCAIDRLGGQQMKQECDHLKTKPLDQTNQEIMIDIKRSNDEIKGLTKSLRSLKRSHNDMKKSHKILQENHNVVKKSHQILQEDHAHMTKEMEIIKTTQQDTVPWNIRARNEKILKTWKDNDDKMFINTTAAEHVLKCIKENSCVTITASSGVGKTATLRHVALQMVEERYDVLILTEPGDIVRFNNPNKTTLFVVDDLCGNFSLDQSDIKSWEPIIEDIKQNLVKEQTKLLAACRLQVYKDEKFNLSVFKSCVCNMLSENICLSKTEKQLIAKLYLNAKASEISDFYDLYDCFPLLCKLYNNNPKLNITDFFQNPFSIYEAEIDKFLKKGHYTKYCALALCVMFNNKLKEEMLTEELNEETRIIIENTCEACRLDRGTSRLVLQDELNSLIDTFIKKENNVYKILHDKIFDFLVKIYGQKIINCLIRNADSGLIKERFLLERRDDMDQLITVIPTKYHQMYIQRMIDDWSNRKLQDVFSNINMKIPQFRQKLLFYLNKLDTSYQRQLAHIYNKCNLFKKKWVYTAVNDEDGDVYDTAFLYCCYIGDTSLFQWCCNHGVNVNMVTYNDQSPLTTACKHGHTKIVQMLLDRGAIYNREVYGYQSPLMEASKHGHIEIVKMFLDRGVYDNTRDRFADSPIMMACNHGHTEIVQMLLDRGAVFNKCDEDGDLPIMMACNHGHTEIVQMLLDRGAAFNKCDEDGDLPIILACEKGHIEIVKMLLDKGVYVNVCDREGRSPVTTACLYGHIEIVKILLDRGADFNLCDKNGMSAVTFVCRFGPTEIVKLLLDRGADCNQVDNFGCSPLREACNHGHIDIVTILLDRGADCNQVSVYGESPLKKACGHGHTEIVKILLDKGADCNQVDVYGVSLLMEACEHGNKKILKMFLDRGAVCCKYDFWYESPVMKACAHGHTEIVKMSDREADCNECNSWDQSPVMKACKHGHTEIVNMLLDNGANCNKCDSRGETPVMYASEHGDIEIVKMLLNRGSDYNKCDNRGQSPVLKACKHGHTEIVNMLLGRGADCNYRDVMGRSAATYALEHGNIEIVKMLLDRGSYCNEYFSCDDSPVMIAYNYEHIEIVKILIDRGADYYEYLEGHRTPLIVACENGHTEIVKMLLDKKVNYDECEIDEAFLAACKSGYTELVKMLLDIGADCTKYLTTACERGQIVILKMLLDRGADCNDLEMLDESLMLACEHGHREIVKMLLDRGADCNACSNGYSLVMKACAHGHREIVKMLLDRDVDCNECNFFGQSALMIAYACGYNDIVAMINHHSSQKKV